MRTEKWRQNTQVSDNINGKYAEGIISLTHSSPRKHIWSFIGGVRENYDLNKCPCGTSGAVSAPSFVGTDYYCESDNPNSYWQDDKFYTTNPLWDGKGCSSIEKPCCTRSNLPWFHKTVVLNDWLH